MLSETESLKSEIALVLKNLNDTKVSYSARGGWVMGQLVYNEKKI